MLNGGWLGVLQHAPSWRSREHTNYIDDKFWAGTKFINGIDGMDGVLHKHIFTDTVIYRARK